MIRTRRAGIMPMSNCQRGKFLACMRYFDCIQRYAALFGSMVYGPGMYASIDRANEFFSPGCCCSVRGFRTCSNPAHPLKRDECSNRAASRFKLDSRSRASPGRG